MISAPVGCFRREWLRGISEMSHLKLSVISGGDDEMLIDVPLERRPQRGEYEGFGPLKLRTMKSQFLRNGAESSLTCSGGGYDVTTSEGSVPESEIVCVAHAGGMRSAESERERERAYLVTTPRIQRGRCRATSSTEAKRWKSRT